MTYEAAIVAQPGLVDSEKSKDHGEAMGLPRLRFFATPSDRGKKENSRSVKFEV